jgi:formylglycine-generating enzyme required for sulfatase activity
VLRAGYALAFASYDLAGNVFEWLGDPRTEQPLHYRPYVGGSFASRPERCDPAWITAHNGANSTFYHGLRVLVER